MEQRIRLNLASTAIVLAAGAAVSVITSTVVAARAYESRGRLAASGERVITVKGSTRRPIRANQAVWQILVLGEHAELAKAYNILDHTTRRVREFLAQGGVRNAPTTAASRETAAPAAAPAFAGAGFRDAEIGLSAIETQTHFTRDAKGNETREIASYSLSRAFIVSTRDVDRVLNTAGRVTELIQEGLLVVSHAPAYYYTDLAALKIELMGAASADARARAEEIATKTGCRVREVRSASMGVLQVTRPFSTEVSDYGMYDTTSVDKDVTAVVTVTFGVSDG